MTYREKKKKKGHEEIEIKAQLTCSLNISNIEVMTGSTPERHTYKDIQIDTHMP